MSKKHNYKWIYQKQFYIFKILCVAPNYTSTIYVREIKLFWIKFFECLPNTIKLKLNYSYPLVKLTKFNENSKILDVTHRTASTEHFLTTKLSSNHLKKQQFLLQLHYRRRKKMSKILRFTNSLQILQTDGPTVCRLYLSIWMLSQKKTLKITATGLLSRIFWWFILLIDWLVFFVK